MDFLGVSQKVGGAVRNWRTFSLATGGVATVLKDKATKNLKTDW